MKLLFETVSGKKVLKEFENGTLAKNFIMKNKDKLSKAQILDEGIKDMVKGKAKVAGALATLFGVIFANTFLKGLNSESAKIEAIENCQAYHYSNIGPDQATFKCYTNFDNGDKSVKYDIVIQGDKDISNYVDPSKITIIKDGKKYSAPIKKGSKLYNTIQKNLQQDAHNSKTKSYTVQGLNLDNYDF